MEKSTVLVVDDVASNLDLLIDILGDEYQVKVATNGVDALRISRGKEQPDLILLDIMMPEVDGYEVITDLKAHPDTAHIPVIFITAKSSVKDEEKGFELGAVDYITKPVSPPIEIGRASCRERVCMFV